MLTEQKHIEPSACMDSLDFFFDQSFPIIKPSQSSLALERKTISMAMSDELIRTSIVIGSDYARLFASVLRFNISEGVSNVEALNGGISWLIPIVKRNEQRSQRKGVSGMNDIDLEGEGPELNGLDLYTFKFKVGSEDFILKRHLHTSIMKHFSGLIKRNFLNGNCEIDLTELNLSQLKGVSTAGNSKYLYIEMLVDMVISLMYCPLLLFDWIFCGKLEVKLECGGEIFDKDFYIMDLKPMVELFNFSDRRNFSDFIDVELFRSTSQANELAEKIVNNWKTTLCESFETDLIYKGSVSFSNNVELDGSEEKRVIIIQDIVNNRSDFFKLMNQSGMKESTDDLIVLDCSSKVMKAVFEYTYIGSITDESIAFELMLYSDLIGYKMLFNTCAQIIKKNIKTMEDASNIYNFATMYEEILGMKVLKCYCAKFCYIQHGICKELKIPKEIVENEPAEDFYFHSYIPFKPKVLRYSSSPTVQIFGWGQQSGFKKVCNVIARNTFTSPPIFTNEGYLDQFVTNPGTSWSESTLEKSMLLCVPVTLENKEEFYKNVEELLEKNKSKSSHQKLAIILTKCDLPCGMWNISRREMHDFVRKVKVSLFESSAYCLINCKEPASILYHLQSD